MTKITPKTKNDKNTPKSIPLKPKKMTKIPLKLKNDQNNPKPIK